MLSNLVIQTFHRVSTFSLISITLGRFEIAYAILLEMKDDSQLKYDAKHNSELHLLVSHVPRTETDCVFFRDCISMIIEKGKEKKYSPNAQNLRGNSALHLAIKNRNILAVQMLIQYEPDFFLPNKYFSFFY